MKKLTARAYAKLNLYLDITGRREDGYHLLETVMQSISLHDVVSVELRNGGGITLRCDREDVPADRRNTAYKAAELFMQAAGISAGVDISIKKHIPSGAGLGGGSADAAAVLRMLNKAAGFPLSEERLLDIAAQVGADVPFCLVGGTKLCWGIGEQLSEFPGLPAAEYVVVKPEFSCPTGEAYRRYDEAPVEPRGGLEHFRNNFPEGMYNVFQTLYADERIERLCRFLREAGAAGAMLTGSGSAVFGVFLNEKQAEHAEQAAVNFPGCRAVKCRAVSEGVTITEEQEGSYDKGSE